MHFTRRNTGRVNAGPNAVLALSREGYRHTDVSVRDLAGTLAFPGSWRMAGRHWRNGVEEWHRSLSKPASLRVLQRLMPEVGERELVAGGSGVRAQALKPTVPWSTISSSCLPARCCTCRTFLRRPQQPR